MFKNDLGLLAVFDTLYEVRSVTRAAERLHITQSAVSHALRRLRQLVDDPLFLRSGGALEPTPRARAMAPAVREGLARLSEAMEPTGFDPQRSQRTFTIAATTYFCSLLIPSLVAIARAQAPGVRLRTVPIRADLLSQLDNGVIDLALGSFSRLPPRIAFEPILSEELVWIAAGTNPVLHAKLTQAQLLEMPHIAFDPVRTFAPIRAEDDGYLDSPYPAEQTLPIELHGSDQTPVILYDSFTAIAVAAGTDLVALVPRQLALAEQARFGIAILETGETGPGIDLSMISRAGPAADSGRDWLRAQVLALASSTLGPV